MNTKELQAILNTYKGPDMANEDSETVGLNRALAWLQKTRSGDAFNRSEAKEFIEVFRISNPAVRVLFLAALNCNPDNLFAVHTDIERCLLDPSTREIRMTKNEKVFVRWLLDTKEVRDLAPQTQLKLVFLAYGQLE